MVTKYLMNTFYSLSLKLSIFLYRSCPKHCQSHKKLFSIKIK